MGYFDQWGEPPSLGRGVYSEQAVRAEKSWLNQLPCVAGGQRDDTREEEYVAQLVGTHPSDYDGREYLEEAVIAQIEILYQSG